MIGKASAAADQDKAREALRCHMNKIFSEGQRTQRFIDCQPTKEARSIMGRERKTKVAKVRVIHMPSDRTPAYDPSKPDPRILELVRILARSAARDYLAECAEAQKRKAAMDGSPHENS